MIKYVNTYATVNAIWSEHLKIDLIGGARCVRERREKCSHYKILVRKTEGRARQLFLFFYGSADLVDLIVEAS